MKKLVVPILAAVTLYSCSNTDDNTVTTNPDEKYLNGYFITNEGNFGKGGASVSHLSADLNTVTNNIFKTANGKDLGDVAQSIVVNDDYAFVIVNNSNTIEVVNKKTFKSVYTITQGLNTPYYATVSNDKLYVTSLYNPTVSVYNAKTFAFIKTIDLNFPATNIVTANNYVYAANGFYSKGTSIEVIDPSSDTNTVDITFDNAINGITTNGQFVYALETNDTASKISKIEGTQVTTSVNIAQGNSRYLVADGEDLFYTVGTGIYKTANTATSSGTKLFDVTPAEDGFSVLYGFNVINGNIFVSDVKGFKDIGTVTIYKENGTVTKEFKTGIGPNGFYKF
ncbi:hypothetical protein NU10_07230 [Flavobacterium dauae]|uniref:YncE family protein n=1 Tax=Flavobacterium dauae TaxID=1563479 RepID=UPI00101B4E3B|nr:DUF5074 domain-containing protein [Flavobacterium dauae]WLD22532.1 hypothetical protein NU10_07230 [Flavobacterium dauae]